MYMKKYILSSIILLLAAANTAWGQTYNIWVGGTQITSANVNDVLGDGTVSYNSTTNTLTLDNAYYSGEGYESSAIYATCDLNIVVTGTNSLAANGFGIYTGGSLTVTGSGSNPELNVSAASTGYAIKAAGSSASFDGITMALTGDRGIVVNENNDPSDAISIENCTITFANGMDRSLQVWNGTGDATLSIENSTVTGYGRVLIMADGATGDAVCSISDNSTVNLNGALGLQIESYYGDCTVDIDGSNVTITATTSANGAINAGARYGNGKKAVVNIKNASNVTLSGAQSGLNVWTWGDAGTEMGSEVNVTGNSTLTANGYYYGISAYAYPSGETDVTFVGSTVVANGGISAIEMCSDASYNCTGDKVYTQTNSNVTLTGGYYGLDVDTSTDDKINTGESKVIITGGTLTSTGGLYVSGDAEGTVTMEDVTATIDVSEVSEEYAQPIATDNLIITSGNYLILGSDGTDIYGEGITGGLFTVDVSDKCAEGYVCVSNTDPETSATYPYVVVKAVAKIGDIEYATLAAAFAAAQDGETITLLADCTGNGIIVPQGKFTTGLTVDFKTFTYTVDHDPLAGSPGTQSQAFQLLKDNTITFKNGTIYSEKARMLVQNYSNLTLDGMTLTLNNTEYTSPAYTLSNNNGNVVIDGCTINANNDNSFAFDVCRYASYPSVNVTVTGNSVINGDVQIDASNSDPKDGFSLTLESGTLNGDIDITANAATAMESAPDKTEVTKNDNFDQAAPDGYAWKDNGDGTSTLAVAVAKIGDVGYATLADAIDAATDGQTITMLTDVELDDAVYIDKSITLDLDGKTISISAAYPDLYAISVSSGTVTITGNGTIDAGDEIALYVLDGAVTIENGSFGTVGVDDGSLTITDGTFGYLMTTGGTTTVNDGEFNGTVQVDGGSLTINDGTFTANDEEVLMAVDGTIIVTGGSFTVTKSGADWPFVAYADAGLIQISGGTFTGGENSVLGVEVNHGGQIEVSGGLFSSVVPTDPTDFCAPGYVPVTTPDANGMYTVQVDAASAVASITNANNETTNYLTLQDAIDAARDGQTITLLKDIDLGSSYYQIIDKAVTIDGGESTQYEIKGTGSDHGTDTEATIVLQGTGNITLKNLKVTNSSTNNNGVGIKGTTYAGKLTIDNCVITVPMRGVNVENIASGFSMDITNSTIQSNIDAPTTTYVDNVDSRGISFSDDDELETTVTITNTTIKGFKYDIYVGENKKNLTLTMNGVEAYGKYLLNLSGDNSTINLNSGTTYANGSLVTDEDAYGASTNIIYLDEATKTAQTYNVLDAVTALTTVSAGTGKYKLVSATAAVVQIGDTKYETLEAAFAAVQNGETITMLKDVTLAAPMDVALGTKAVTLDLGGNTLSGRTNLKNGELTIKNGTVAGGNQQALNVYGSATAGATNYSVLNINSDVTVTADQFGVCMFGPTYNSKPGYGAVINIAGTVHTTGNGAEGAVFVSGNLGNNIVGDMNNVINITGSITSDTDAAIALNGNATVNVQDGAAITGNTAIAIKRGTLNVEGGTVHATGLNNIPTPGNNNGTEMTGAAVSMSNTYNQYGGMQVNITGGSFTSDHAMALYKEEDTYQNDATYAVSGGIFNTPVQEEFCAEGYVPTSITTQGFTQYTVAPGDFVAQIGDTKYTTLAAAVAAVPTNGTETTITLLKDITLYNNVVVGGTFDGTNNSNAKKTTAITNQNVILNLDGHTITGTKTLYLAGGSLNITGTGSIISTSPDVAPVGVRYVKTDNYPDLDYTSKRTLTIGSDVTLTGAQYGLNIFGTNEASKANNIDVTVDGTVNGMLFVLGNLSNANNNIVINVSGTVDASRATGSEKVKTGIALCGNASVHIIDGAVVKGESGIEVRAGELIMDGDVGGTITATADYSYEANGSGTTTKGAAIAVAQHGTKIATSATILGGTLTGAKKIAVIDAQPNSLSGVTVIAADGYLTNSATETVLPDGYYWLSNGDGTSSPAPNSAVAQIGNTLYSTLAAAVAAVPADGTPTTITLLQNINLTERLFVNAGATPVYAGSNNRYATTTENKNITLELDGHNIVSSSNIALAGGSLNITNNGTADATHGVISTTAGGLAPIEVRGTGDLTKKRTLTVGTGVTLSGAEYGLNIFGSNDQQKNIIDVNVNGTVNGMLFELGNLKNADNEININVNGTVDASGVTTGTGEAVHSGIALGGNANVTVADGAVIKGESGIEARAVQLTINGGTIPGTATAYSYAANGTKGAAVAVAQHTTVLPVSVTLNGGTLTGAKKIVVTDVNINYLTDVSVVANNSFVANVTDTEIPAGFLWVDNGNNTKKLVLAPARIGNVGYATLAEAIAAVQDGQSIKLFADITLTDDISTNTSFTLDFNSHNVIRNGNHVVLAEGVSILTNVAASQLFSAEGDNVVVESNSGNTDYPYEYSVKKSIANAGITISVNSATYTGEVQTPTVTVKDGNNVLVAGTHYTISYKGSELKNANTYVEEIIITGIGDYAGTKTADFTINKRNINDVTVEGHSQTYTTSGYTTSQIEGLIKLKYNDIPLVVSTDYTIAVDDTKTYKDSGTYPEVITLTAVPGGNFEGSRKVNFYIGGAKDITTSNIIATVVYNGSAQVPSEATVTVKDGNTNQPLTLGTDFTLEYFQNYEYINAQTYVNAITIVGIGTYYGTKTVDYIITPKDISGCIINNSTPFTGAVIDPATVVTVKDGNTTLSSTDDYTLTVSQGHTYQNPQTYGNAITITGKGNYTGTKTMDFIITQTDAINLATAAVVISKQTYTGADLKPTAATTTVTVNGAALDPANYTFSFVPEGDNFYKDAKVYSNAIIITASTTQSTYYGTVVGNYIIEPRDLSDAGVTVTATDLDYNTNEQNVSVTVKYGNNEIPAANYTFEPTKVTEAGQYTVTVTAVENSNLVGSRTVVLKVTKALDGTYASDFTVSPDPIPTQTETGNEIKPVIVVKDKDRVMTSGVDYTVAYTNNINAGTATITITGTGAYSGTKTINFTIVTAYFTENGITYHHANEGEEVSVGNSGKTLAVDINTTGNPVAVPQTVTHDNKTYTVTGVEQNAFSSTAITGIVLPKSIEEVENGAFSGANNLRYVDLSTATGFTPSSLQRNIAASPFYDVPKQALVFLNGTTFTGENYVYNPGSGNDYYCEVFKIYDDLSGAQTGFGGDDYKWAFENPYQFTAYSVENTRQLTAERHYTTCLPYALEIPNNVKAYTLEATSDKLFGFKEVTGTLAAYTPYVLIPTKSGQLLGSNNNTVIPAFQPATDADATKLNGQAASNFTMYGTMRYMEGADAQGKYIMQYNNGNPTWKQITETNAGFNASNKACILPMRAYIMSNTSGSREFFDVVFTNIDGTTLTFDKVTFDDDTIYDLSGRKVELLERGHTYIINGKKVIVK